MDYKTTLNLPKTDFPMKANLSKNEPEIIKKWEEKGIYNKISQTGKNRQKYILHDGPPYANGHIHIGHALNKILKDIIVKSKYMSGFATDYVPGWDCHGLPIELQVEKDLGAKKNTISKVEVRKKCRAYAEKFVNIQKEEFKRLGIFGEWDEPYLTMNYKYQSDILRELGKCVEKGIIYKGKKPVHWCSSCQTALAEAEVEYADKKSPSVYVKFKVPSSELKEKLPSLVNKNVSIIIWTTTPWTLPANLAIALHPELEYAAVEIADRGEVFIIAKGLLEQVAQKLNWHDYKILETFYPAKLENIKARHPFIERDSLIILGTHVTLDAGTGCVHIAPGHGQDDYELGLKYELDIYNPVDNQGKFTKDVPEFEGQKVFDANKNIVELLKTKGALLKEEVIEHSYPHCWRCKNPIIFRATEQWFIEMEGQGGYPSEGRVGVKGQGNRIEKYDLRKKALEAIDKVEWIPSWGRDRIYNMVANRPDWCISRQRAWGVPITAFNCKACGHTLLAQNIINKIADEFEKNGADVWFEKDAKGLLPTGTKCPKCGSAEFEKEENILDVWFDSGVSFAAVLEKRDNLKYPADLYLEGSDQHRGWFHSALLTSVGTRGIAPYKAVLTHGFVVDGSGKKMSKSTGNVIAPQEVIDKYGAEVLRLWVSAEDYRDDIRISDEILTRLSDAYRRIRNTCRYILGNLYDFEPEKALVPYEELLELDRLILHRLTVLNERILKAYNDFEFHVIYHSLHNFCSVDLSAFYLDVIKDRLYTSKADSKNRRAAQTTIYHVLDYIVRLMSPIISFTSDEVWQFMPGRKEESIHLASFPASKKEWINEDLAEKWDVLLNVKAEAAKALESARRDKVIGHSLDAMVIISVDGELKKTLEGYISILKDILIVSQISLPDKIDKIEGAEVLFGSEEVKGLKIGINKAKGEKCERCWNYSEQVGEFKEHPKVCERCVEALK
ncbi:MAG: isoleucine--tRNA ligase [Deltaproteobacteria bacterium]|nr:isoleucine--tRNA ligase [Deltaproteobacteria bacterium]